MRAASSPKHSGSNGRTDSSAYLRREAENQLEKGVGSDRLGAIGRECPDVDALMDRLEQPAERGRPRG